MQAFAPIKSYEFRLICKQPYEVVYHDTEDFEQKMFAYVNIRRPYGFHINDNADKSLGFDHCADCAIENQIWKVHQLSRMNHNSLVLKYVSFYLKISYQIIDVQHFLIEYCTKQFQIN